ncbi:MAG: hypothetical protein ACJ74Z_00610 [Bryobacteraceae bacterium]
MLATDDPSLGLTNIGEQGPDDWAAETGPAVNAGSGVRSRTGD